MKLLLFLLALFPTVVQAHQLKTDNSMGVIVHVDPNDEPIAGEPGGYYFEFQDKNDAFKLADCTCSVIISQGARELYSQELAQASLSSASFRYTLPDPGIYQVKVIGVPKTGTFQPFSVTFDVRAVAGDSRQTNPIWITLGVVVLGLAVAGVLGRRKRPTSPPDNSSSRN